MDILIKISVIVVWVLIGFFGNALIFKLNKWNMSLSEVVWLSLGGPISFIIGLFFIKNTPVIFKFSDKKEDK